MIHLGQGYALRHVAVINESLICNFGCVCLISEKNKNPEISTVTQAKSEWENGYFSTKRNVTTAELVQAQDMCCVRGQMPVPRHLPVRCVTSCNT